MGRTIAEVRLQELSPEALPRPTLFIDGKPHSGLSYMTYKPDGQSIRQFYDAGCRVFFFSCTPDDCMYEIADQVWLGPDRYDYSQFDERLALFLEHAPDAFFIPRVYMTSPPWWDEAHPDELVVFDDGSTEQEPHIHTAKKRSYPSLASEAWRRATVDNLQRFLRHVEDGPYGDRIAGYHLASQHTEEWFSFWVYKDYLGDYSAPAHRAWRAWLRAHYGTDEALRRAWGRDDVTIDSAPMPTGDERRAHYRAEFRGLPAEQPCIDYARFFSDLTVETLEVFCKAGKEATGGRKLIGVFYGYLLQFAEHLPVSGHSAVQRAFASPWIDFYSSPSAYIDRRLGPGYAFFMSLPESVRRHGKLWINENDIHTWVYMEREQAWGLQKMHGVENHRDSLMIGRREVANSLAHGMGMWWFDFWARWYDDPEHMEEVAALLRLDERLLGKQLASTAEVLLVVDADSTAAQGWRTLLGPCLSRLVVQLGHLGAPFDVVETGDLERVLADRHKLVLFPNLWTASRERRWELVRRLSDSRTTALWLYAPCAVGAPGDPVTDAAARAAELLGFPVALSNRAPIAPTLAPVDVPETSNASDFVRRWRERQAAQPLTAPAVPEEISSEAKMTPFLCTPVDADAKDCAVLARTAEGKPGLAACERDGWTGVWCAAPMLLDSWLRAIAAAAGVHLWLDSGDTVYANQDLLCVAARAEAGPRTVRLPAPRTVRDAMTGETVARNADTLTLDMEAKEVRLFELE